MHREHVWHLIFGMPEARFGCHECCNANAFRDLDMTALLLVAVATAAAVNVSLVAFVADRLTPKTSTTATTTGRSVNLNDNRVGAATLKHAA